MILRSTSDYISPTQTIWHLLVIVHHGNAWDPSKLPRQGRARPGIPAMNDDHFPGTRTRVPSDYEVRPRSADEAGFLAIGDGARTWLLEAAAARTARMNVKMAEAVTLAKIAGTDHVDRALGDATLHGRFAHPDLASILNANIHAANEATSPTEGAAAWAAIGNPALNPHSQQQYGGGPMSPMTTTNTGLHPCRQTWRRWCDP
jgi:hypothetical protein